MAGKKEQPSMKLGGVELVTPKARISRFSLMLWGSSGGGKTTLACTAPGKKLLISYDPDGSDAIAYRDDVVVMDLANEPNRSVESFKEDDPLRLKSRMFITSGEPEFDWKYDADEDEGPGIETWYDQWVVNGGKKIPLPE
jgi:hypothetical protein